MGFISKLSLVVIILIAQIAAQVIFSENFEGSTSGWTVSPATNGWEFGTPTVGPASTPEGVRCAGTILNGQYINHANYSMTSPSITLPSNTPFNLTYYSWLGRETCCDHASLEIERNGTWTRVNYDSGSTSWRLITTNIDSYSGSTIRLRFTFTSDVSSVNYGWYVDDIRISQIPSVNLTIQNDLNGSATPSGIVSVRSNSPCTISATPNTNFRFDKWSIISGSPVIGDSFSTPTTVTTSTESSIRANFKPCTVYTITTTPQQYNYNQNYYTSITNGVRFKFTAPMTGTFGVTFQNVSSYTNYIYYYGRDSLFTTSVRSNTNSSTITMTITANTGENHYFRVYTSSSYYNRNFNIYYSPPVTLTVSKSGSGWTSPSGTVEVLSGAATSISAVSSGGYLFQNWTAVRGNPVIASATSATTSVTATADSSEIRANFIINPNTRPNTQISDINISSHPDICLTASVTDSAGRSITGLDTNNFILTQDSDTVPFQLSTVSNIAGVSVSLVIDISGSMDTDLPAAKEAALQYVRSMGPLDRCAIVSFDDVVTVEQTITSDTSLLIPAISRLTYDGRTAIINGAYTGVQQLLQETNTSAVIIYSDGLDNESTTPLATAINLAKQNSIRIYSIGLGSSADRSILGALADSTGGYYTYSPTAAGLASIYAQIKSDVQAQYILCYQTPDAIFNGDTHQVVLSVSLNNSTSKDTVYWNENNSPPVITLTSQTEAMIGVNQTPNQPLTISADVTDDGTVQQVRFFYRRSGTTAGAFTEVSMTYISGSLYQYIVPAAQVILPGIDFYILATDNYNIIGRSPNVLAPETQPYVIPVSNDVPVIAHTQPSCVTPSLDQTISSTITDQNGIFIALLYFKRGNETFYTIDTMSLSGSATYSGTIPASMIGTNGIDYYFRAIDNIGAAVRYQRSGSIHLSLCNISNPPVANAGLDQTLFTDNSSCVVTATLDGTASTNPDGGTLTYSWTGPFTGSLPGATPSVNLDTGTNQIILNVSNGAGLIDLDTVIITVRDTLPPAFSQATLSDITAQCSVTLPIPTATDNCGGVINGTTPITTFDTQGTFSVEWTYRDPSGNTSRQLQNVIIDDNTPPVPDQPQLLTITSTCGVELTPPTATDSCSGKIAATTSSPLSINNQGTYTITWTYDDGNGNTETQDQTVIIKDSIPPVFAALSDRVITTKSAVSGANLTVETARATDNCTQVSVQGVRSDALRLDTLFFEGATRITWTACDTNNNCSYASQTITVIRNRAPALQIPTDTSLSEGEILTFSVSASDTDGTIPFLFIDSLVFPFVFKDSANGHATLSLRPGCTDHGTYTVKVHASDGIDTTTREFAVNIIDINYPPEFDTTSYYVAHEMVEFKTMIKVYDCDNPNPRIRIINAPKEAVFTDNNNGTGTFIWTPDADDNGFYMIIFEAQDDMTTVRDTIIIEITDVNAYPPDITVSVSDTMVPLNLPIVIYATAKDRDGTPTIIRASGLPSGAQFESDNNGTALVRWTPADTGIFKFDFIAIDAADTTIKVSKQVQLKVSNINVTGPKFSPVQDFIIDQNKQFTTTLEAHDPDGTIPVLHLKGGQQTDLTFTDNGNGTATVNWIPPCNVSGTFYVTVSASDQSFTDSITFAITVRDVNCPPVIFRTSDINAKTGEMVRVYIRSYDPDGDTVIPTLSVVCTLPGHTFTSSGNGTAVFRWQAIYESGSYPVTFYASDGIVTDSFTLHININMTGNVTIIGTIPGSNIYVTPNGSYKGEFIGTDTSRLSVAPGIYHFEVNKSGYRSERFAVRAFADSSVVKICTLRQAIPLMTSLQDTSFLSQIQNASHSPCAFADLNSDGYLDYTVLNTTGIKVYPGLDSTGIKFNSKPYDLPDSVPAGSIFYYGFIDWNNDKSIDCIYSDLSGNIIVANFRTGTFEPVVSVPGGKLYFSVLDVNNDNKKDLVVHNEGYGLSVYLNQGTDNSPAFTSSYLLSITSGQTPATLHGPLSFIDIDGNSTLELLIKNERTPALFKINSTFNEISYIEDLNCAGKRIISDTLTIFQIGSPSSLPHIILSTAANTMLFRTHLLGDVNNDSKVDIRDISKISRLWELTDTDPSWDPECNLKLSASGQERIDIRDISSVSKSWELQQ